MQTLDSVATASIDSFTGRWSVARTSSRFMPYLILDLQRQNVGCFIPTGRLQRHRIDRGRSYSTRGERRPIFGGHTLFINTADIAAPSEAISIFKKRIPTATAGLQPVVDQKRLDWELRNLARSMQADPDYCFTAPIGKGQTVRVIAGPMMGVTGVVVDSCRGKCDVQLSVTLLGRAVQLEVPADFVEQA